MVLLYDLGSSLLGAAVANPALTLVASLAVLAALVTIARRRGWLGRARRHPRATAAILVPLLAIAVPVGWYLTSPLVLSASVDEPPPSVAAGPSSPAPATPVAASPSAAPSRTPPSAAPATPPPTPTPALIARAGAFHGSDDFHFGRGTARLLETAPGTFVVRLENFAVRNGPDLYVYLSPSPDGYVDGAIELGRLKADTGNQNYAVPAGALVDPARAASVVIWCKQFSHLFATAPLAA